MPFPFATHSITMTPWMRWIFIKLPIHIAMCAMLFLLQLSIGNMTSVTTLWCSVSDSICISYHQGMQIKACSCWPFNLFTEGQPLLATIGSISAYMHCIIGDQWDSSDMYCFIMNQQWYSLVILTLPVESSRTHIALMLEDVIISIIA